MPHKYTSILIIIMAARQDTRNNKNFYCSFRIIASKEGHKDSTIHYLGSECAMHCPCKSLPWAVGHSSHCPVSIPESR